jgi:hypothetical protein
MCSADVVSHPCDTLNSVASCLHFRRFAYHVPSIPDDAHLTTSLNATPQRQERVNARVAYISDDMTDNEREHFNKLFTEVPAPLTVSLNRSLAVWRQLDVALTFAPPLFSFFSRRQRNAPHGRKSWAACASRATLSSPSATTLIRCALALMRTSSLIRSTSDGLHCFFGPSCLLSSRRLPTGNTARRYLHCAAWRQRSGKIVNTGGLLLVFWSLPQTRPL